MRILRTDAVRDRVVSSRLLKCPQSQCAAVADAACNVALAIAGPCEMKRRVEFETAPDNVAFLKIYQRRLYCDLRLRASSRMDHGVERLIVFGTAVGVSRA